jgi:AcrR family transcriptional regulator
MAINTHKARAAPPPRTARGEETVARALDVAERLFAERGFRGTSLRDVASAAGIRAPSLYNHVPAKEALYEAVLERALRPNLEMLDEFLGRGQSAYSDERLIESMMTVLAERPDAARLLHYEILAGGDRMNELVRGWLESLYGKGMEALENSPQEGPWSREELPRLLFAFGMLFTGYFSMAPAFEAVFGEDPLTDEAVARQKVFLRKLWSTVWSNGNHE